MLNPVIKSKWLAALRSGKYKQCRGTLKRKQKKGYGYCCLGVLEDVCEMKSTRRKVLSNTLLEITGLTEIQQAHLAAMNDKGRDSFSNIADYIEKRL